MAFITRAAKDLRAWTSWIHLAVGLALPILLLIHILLGKRTSPTAQSQRNRALRLEASRIDIQSPVITGPNAALNEGSSRAEFQVAHRRGYSIFTLPLWKLPPSGIFAYGRNNRISA